MSKGSINHCQILKKVSVEQFKSPGLDLIKLRKQTVSENKYVVANKNLNFFLQKWFGQRS